MKEVLTIDLDEATKRDLAELASIEGVSITALAERALRTGLPVIRSRLNQIESDTLSDVDPNSGDHV